MTYKAKKVVIITEKIILDGVVKLIEKAGAVGYTVTPCGGKGSRNVRSLDRAPVIAEFANVKIEIIVADDELASKITEQVVETYFKNYSGITYLQEAEILRPQKFAQKP
ncbi:MAG: P-II family nitrogen regulator [Pseudomonadota bacterium]